MNEESEDTSDYTSGDTSGTTSGTTSDSTSEDNITYGSDNDWSEVGTDFLRRGIDENPLIAEQIRMMN